MYVAINTEAQYCPKIKTNLVDKIHTPLIQNPGADILSCSDVRFY